MNIQITVDGACNKWKRMAVGYVVRDASTQKILDRGHRAISGRGTNNVSEYIAILTACDIARQLKPKKVIIYTDSQLVLRQLKGEYAVRNVRLRTLFRLAISQLRALRAVVRWHSREEGDGPLADKLASYRYKEALNAGNNGEVQQGGTGKHDCRPPAETAGHETSCGG